MELFLCFLILICLLIALFLTALLIKRIEYLEKVYKIILTHIDGMEKDIESITESNRTSMAKDQEPAKPIRPNNWDSIRQIFKKPARSMNEPD